MKILVRLPNWLGDLVMSAAFMECLRQTYPTAQVDVIVKRGLEEIASRFSGISYVYVFDKKLHPGLRGAMRFGGILALKLNMTWLLRCPTRLAVQLCYGAPGLNRE